MTARKPSAMQVTVRAGTARVRLREALEHQTRRTMLDVLRMLERGKPLSVKDIADTLDVSKQTVERIIEDLNTYFVLKTERDPDHKQRKLYYCQYLSPRRRRRK